MKMKTSVIFGVTQMSLGIFMKAFNSVYFRRWLDFFFEFIPQIILLTSLFGFMDFLIINKWLKFGPEMEQSSTAPSIIAIMINMFLKSGNPVDDTTRPIIGSYGSDTQKYICLALLGISFV